MSESPVSQQSVPYGNGVGVGATTPQYSNGQAAPPAESAVRKKLNGYVGFANLPNQVHRKSVRTGFQFTVMVVGELPRPTRTRVFLTRRVSAIRTTLDSSLA